MTVRSQPPEEAHRPSAADELQRRGRLNNLASRVLAYQASESEEDELAWELEPRATSALRRTGTRMLGPRSQAVSSARQARSDGWSIARQTIHECRLRGTWRAAVQPAFAYLLGAVHHKAIQEVRKAQGTEIKAGRRLPRKDPVTEPLDGLAFEHHFEEFDGFRPESEDSILRGITTEHLFSSMLDVLSPGERQAMRIALEADERDVDEQDVARERGLEPNNYRQSKARAARKLLKNFYGLSSDEHQAYLAGRKVSTKPKAEQASAGASHLAALLSRPVQQAEYLRLQRAAQNKIYLYDRED